MDLEVLLRKVTLALLLILALAFSYSCGSDSGGGGGTSQSSFDLTGVWTGTWVSSQGHGKGALNITITQNGTALTGKGTITAGGTKYSGTISGTITDPNGPGQTTFTMKLDNGNAAIVFTGNYTATTIKGTFTDTAGDKGTFSMQKK